jgi:hypothetical protein
MLPEMFTDAGEKGYTYEAGTSLFEGNMNQSLDIASSFLERESRRNAAPFPS